MPTGKGRPFTAAQKANQAYKTALDMYPRNSPQVKEAREKALSKTQQVRPARSK